MGVQRADGFTRAVKFQPAPQGFFLPGSCSYRTNASHVIPQKHWQLSLGVAYSPPVWQKMEGLGKGEAILPARLSRLCRVPVSDPEVSSVS